MFTATLILLLALANAPADCPPGATPQTFQVTAGTVDAFAAPSEPTSQSTLLTQLPYSFAPFDTLNPDRHFGHTITGLPCNTTAATLTLRLRVNHSLAYNDSIALQFKGGSSGFVWSHAIRPLTLDLAALPLAAGGTTSLIDEIVAAGYLDIYLQDDTAVDYATLSGQHCLGQDCNRNGIDDTCEAPGGFTCPATQIVNLSAGKCCAPLDLTPVYASVCASGNELIVNDYDPAQVGSLSACFPPGQTTVTFTVSTVDGQTQQCQTVVDVRDTTPPTITLCPRLK
jgi:hypothetical protein